MNINSKHLKYIEIFAYILALWSFVVLFFESILSYYTDIRSIELITAVANISLLVMLLIGRLLSQTNKENQIIIIIDFIILVLSLMIFVVNVRLVVLLLLIRQTYFIGQFIIFHAFEGRLYRLMSSNPPITLMLSFAVTILSGTVLLMLPAASTKNSVTPFINALFTATSATCVTGLIVVDTGTYFTSFGQFVILALIQIGGLGIMTISTAFAVIIGQRLTLKIDNVMKRVMGETTSLNMMQLVKNIVLVNVSRFREYHWIITMQIGIIIH